MNIDFNKLMIKVSSPEEKILALNALSAKTGKPVGKTALQIATDAWLSNNPHKFGGEFVYAEQNCISAINTLFTTHTKMDYSDFKKHLNKITDFNVGDAFLVSPDFFLVILKYSYNTYVLGGYDNSVYKLYSDAPRTKEEMLDWLTELNATKFTLTPEHFKPTN